MYRWSYGNTAAVVASASVTTGVVPVSGSYGPAVSRLSVAAAPNRYRRRVAVAAVLA